MVYERVMTLQQNIRLLHEALASATLIETGLSESERPWFEEIHKSITRMNPVVQALPSDDMTWAWINFSITLFQIKYGLKALITRLTHVWSLPHLSHEARERFDQQLHLAEDAHTTLESLIRIQYQMYCAPDSPFIAVSPAFLAVAVLAYFDMRAHKIVMPSPMPHTRPILYHPHHTSILLTDILQWIGAVQPLNLTFKSDGIEGIEIHLTTQPHRLTPQIWERLEVQADSLEVLREIGGQIEPLAWDEGYGQGVIVRLPWAR